MIWARLHWVMGVASLLGFLAAGLYMRDVPDVPAIEDAPRMVYRSRFLFLLLVAVINLVMARAEPAHWVEKVAAAIVLVAPAPLVMSFLGAAPQGIQGSLWTRWTMRALFGAGLLLAYARRPRTK